MKNIHRIGAVIAGLALAYPAPLAMAVTQNTASAHPQAIVASQGTRVVTQDDVNKAQKKLEDANNKVLQTQKELKDAQEKLDGAQKDLEEKQRLAQIAEEENKQLPAVDENELKKEQGDLDALKAAQTQAEQEKTAADNDVKTKEATHTALVKKKDKTQKDYDATVEAGKKLASDKSDAQEKLTQATKALEEKVKEHETKLNNIQKELEQKKQTSSMVLNKTKLLKKPNSKQKKLS